MGKIKALLTAVVLGLTPLLAGCVPQPISQQSSSPKTPSPQVSVDASYSGKEVEVAVNGTLVVTLESNLTTGFKWLLTSISDPSVLKMVESRYEGTQPVEPTTPIVGAGGMETWTFIALKAGSTIISMSIGDPGKLISRQAGLSNLP